MGFFLNIRSSIEAMSNCIHTSFVSLIDLVQPMQIKSSNGLFWLKTICFYFSTNKSIKLVERVHLCKNSVSDAVRKGACGQGFEGVLRWQRPFAWPQDAEKRGRVVMFRMLSFPALSPGRHRYHKRSWNELFWILK